MRSSGESSASVELLEGIADARPVTPLGRRSIWRTVSIVGSVIVLYVAFLWLPNVGAAQAGEVHPVETHFSDPFAIDWISLEGPGDPAAAYPRPRPMASIHPPCVGFGRVDWPEPKRRPSVAHCIDPGTASRLPSDGIAILRESVAGADTWYVFLFGGDIEDVSVRIDNSLDLGPERIYQGGPYAAILLPNGYERLRLVWQLSKGVRYQCSLPSGSIGAHACE